MGCNMGQAQALSGLLSLNAWDVGCKNPCIPPRRLQISTQTAQNRLK